MRKFRACIGLGACLGLSSYSALAIEHSFSGTVTKITPQTIDLRKDSETLQFTRKPGSYSDLRVGDQVVISTDLEANGIKKEKHKKEEAGQKGKPILDDRAFYSASSGNPQPGEATPAPKK
ncbi:MAG: hypothetical protein P4M08_09795 [Oligoflexia bacterium]|nr:hypothetical protein [Oligoflexia bacterium]